MKMLVRPLSHFCFGDCGCANFGRYRRRIFLEDLSGLRFQMPILKAHTNNLFWAILWEIEVCSEMRVVGGIVLALRRLQTPAHVLDKNCAPMGPEHFIQYWGWGLETGSYGISRLQFCTRTSGISLGWRVQTSTGVLANS